MIQGCVCERAVPYKQEYLDYYNAVGEYFDRTIPDTQEIFNTTYDVTKGMYVNYTIVNRIYSKKFYRYQPTVFSQFPHFT
jgi:hypothetical protein